MPLSGFHIAETLIPRLQKLRADALALEHEFASTIEGVEHAHRASARNLLHYLALRQSDLRDLQADLAQLGLSRLGRAEAHTLNSIDAVMHALRALADLPRLRQTAPEVDFTSGAKKLSEHAMALFGASPDRHSGRIMVTMPSEAAQDPALIRELLLAGMNVMRINCAHDGPDEWIAMIRHLRDAEKAVGQHCRIYADLAGPKLRTGDIRASGRVVEFKVQRDMWGRMLAPARIWLTSSAQPETAPAGFDASLQIEPDLLAQMQSGDFLDVDDARGSSRRLVIQEQAGISWAECAKHSYIADGAACRLERENQILAEGKIGPLPEVSQPIMLAAGDLLCLTISDEPGMPASYDSFGKLLHPASIPCSLPAVFESAKAGDPIWFDDGKIGGEIYSNDGSIITVKITQAAPGGSKLRSGKGINLPLTEIATPALSGTDLENLRLLAPLVDLVGLSFVRSAADVAALHRHLHEMGAPALGTILKIETRQAFENLPLILLESLRHPPAGIMVARGDLAVEIGFERLAEVQEEIIWLCEAAHVPVIWATQVLDSMARRGMPSRAEVSDAAHAVRAECVMLNKGPYIVETVKFLSGILHRMSGHQAKQRPIMRPLSVSRLGH
jgi:pyruvate kinase